MKSHLQKTKDFFVGMWHVIFSLGSLTYLVSVVKLFEKIAEQRLVRKLGWGLLLLALVMVMLADMVSQAIVASLIIAFPLVFWGIVFIVITLALIVVLISLRFKTRKDNFQKTHKVT